MFLFHSYHLCFIVLCTLFPLEAVLNLKSVVFVFYCYYYYYYCYYCYYYYYYCCCCCCCCCCFVIIIIIITFLLHLFIFLLCKIPMSPMLASKLAFQHKTSVKLPFPYRSSSHLLIGSKVMNMYYNMLSSSNYCGSSCNELYYYEISYNQEEYCYDVSEQSSCLRMLMTHRELFDD